MLKTFVLTIVISCSNSNGIEQIIFTGKGNNHEGWISGVLLTDIYLYTLTLSIGLFCDILSFHCALALVKVIVISAAEGLKLATATISNICIYSIA